MNSIKCPQCGLVNFSTSADCKRCGTALAADYGDEPMHDYAPHSYAIDHQPLTKPVFSGPIVFLSGLLIVAIALLGIQQGFHPFDSDTAKGVGGLIGVIGLLLYAVSHIWLLIRIFEQSIGWGFASLFIPIVGIVAVVQFWDKTKRSFVGQFVCLAILVVGIGIGL